jgi:2-hydroxy-6-oxonona-2,4-dienedioate hydrolase
MTPHSLLQALDDSAQTAHTPCGAGHLVWRRWGKGAPLVLLHGGSGSWKHWVRNIEELAGHYEVWAPDMPGYGDSADPPEPVDFMSIARIINAGFAELRPGASFRLAGFSLGSVVASYMASAEPERVERLVVINGHLLGPLIAQPRQMLTRWRDIVDPVEFDRVMRDNLSVLMMSNREAIDDLAVQLYSEDLRKARLRPIALMDNRDDGILLKLRSRTICIAGEFDPIASPSVEAQMAALRAARPDVETHIMPGIGHWAMYEGAQAMNALMARVLA